MGAFEGIGIVSCDSLLQKIFGYLPLPNACETITEERFSLPLPARYQLDSAIILINSISYAID